MPRLANAIAAGDGSGTSKMDELRHCRRVVDLSGLVRQDCGSDPNRTLAGTTHRS